MRGAFLYGNFNHGDGLKIVSIEPPRFRPPATASPPLMLFWRAMSRERQARRRRRQSRSWRCQMPAVEPRTRAAEDRDRRRVPSRARRGSARRNGHFPLKGGGAGWFRIFTPLARAFGDVHSVQARVFVAATGAMTQTCPGGRDRCQCCSRCRARAWRRTSPPRPRPSSS